MAYKLDCILVVLGLVLLAHSGSALRCWDCSSHSNSLCGDPLNVTTTLESFHTRICGAAPYETSKPLCRKIVKREYGERIVVRQCSVANSDEINIDDGTCSAMATGGRGVIESCHICNTDLCNSGTSASVTHLLIGGTLLLAGQRLLHSKYNL